MRNFVRFPVVAVASGLLLCAFTLSAAEQDAKTESVKVKDITLTVPADWKQQPPSNNLRLAQFAIPKAKGDAETGELVISSFGGGGGGVKANVSRWVGQFQAKGRKQKITQGESKSGKYVFVEISGTYNKPDGPPFLRRTKPQPGSRMLGVILEVQGKGIYFLKMTGLDKTVEAAAQPLRSAIGADTAKEKPFEI